MELRQFLAFLHQLPPDQPMPSTCFQGAKTYPLLFFALLLSGLKKTGRDIVSLDQERETMAQMSMRLETTFLGLSSVYWLRSVNELDKKTQHQVLSYLREYQGPHTIIIATNDPIVLPSSWSVVTLPDIVDKHLFVEIARWSGVTVTTRMMQGVDALYARTKNICLDKAVLLIHYFKTVGVHQQQFMDSWLDYIVEPDKSLFTLSQYFFAQDKHAFFTAWKKIAPEYAESFWVSFWSEQVWRAFYYVQLMRMQKIADAKKMAYRLPFSFIQRDWKKVDSHVLLTAHAQLYALDHALKNGRGMHGLDLVLSQFLLH